MSHLDESNASYSSAQDQMSLLPNYYRWTYGSFRPLLKGNVLELGAGAGLGIETYRSQADHVIAADHDPVLLERLKDRLPEVETVQVDLLGRWDPLIGRDIDVAIMMDVIEHFADPAAFARKVREVLCPGGLAVVKVPAQRRLYSEADRASGHYMRYDPSDLVELMESQGFTTLQVKYINSIGALAYKRRGKEKKNFSKTFSGSQLRLINTAIPALALVDRVIPLRGLSLIGVFQRPDVQDTAA